MTYDQLTCRYSWNTHFHHYFLSDLWLCNISIIGMYILITSLTVIYQSVQDCELTDRYYILCNAWLTYTQYRNIISSGSFLDLSNEWFCPSSQEFSHIWLSSRCWSLPYTIMWLHVCFLADFTPTRRKVCTSRCVLLGVPLPVRNLFAVLFCSCCFIVYPRSSDYRAKVPTAKCAVLNNRIPSHSVIHRRISVLTSGLTEHL